MENQKKWYMTSFRRNLVDMHIEGWDPAFLSQFDAKRYLQALLDANVQSTMIYVNSHVGYCYWPTETGEMHPGFRGESKMESLFEGCRQHNIRTVAYYTLVYNNWVYHRYPQWRMVDLNGLCSRDRRVSKDPGVNDGDSGNRYGLCCPNNPEYRRFTASQIREFSALFDFDGVFFDMCFWPLVCYCDSCRERYRRETGGEIPEVIDWHSDEWLRFQAKRIAWISDFAQFATDEIKSCKPGVTVEHQGSTLFGGTWIRGVGDSLIRANDYVGGDLYGGQKQQSLACKVFYTMTPHQPFEYMTSRCDPDLYNHTTMKSLEMLRLQNAITLAHHGAFLVIDAIDPVGTLYQGLYAQLGRVFAESKVFEPYLTGELLADVGLLFSHNAKPDADRNGMPASDPDYTKPHLAAISGAAAHLSGAHIPYGVAVKGSDLGQYQVVVVSQAKLLDEGETEALVEYVARGGNLYVSGHTHAPVLQRLLGVKEEGMTESTVTYISPVSAGVDLFPSMSAKYPATVFSPMPLLSGAGKEEVLATITLPGTIPHDPTRFVSIHSNPPWVQTEYPAIIKARYGKGTVVWVAAAIEQYQQQVYRECFLTLVRSMMAQPPVFRIDGHPATEGVLFSDAARRRMCISLLNVQEELPLIPVMNTRVSVKMDARPARLLNVRSGETVDFKMENGYAVFEAGPLEMFEMFELQWEGDRV